MKILILGAGGTGGYFGGRLCESKADVTFLVRPRRAELLAREGLHIESPRGSLNIKVRTILAEQIRETYDLVLLSCKAYDLQDAIQSVRAAVGPQTFILPVLNGLQHLSVLEKSFSAKQVLGGVAYIASTLGPQGQILHLNAMDTLTFGPRDPQQLDFCQNLEAVFRKASFESRLSQNIMQDMWAKFVFLSTLAGMNCLMRGAVGEILAADQGKNLLLRLFNECNTIAERSEYTLPSKYRQAYLAQLMEVGSSLTASMLRDLQNHSRVEADAIVGDMLKRGLSFGLDLPILSAAYTHLQVYQATLSPP